MIRHLLIMSGLSSSCTKDCSGRGECYNGTCTCDIRFAGDLCDGPNFPYHVGIGGVFFFISFVCAVQLIICITSEYVRLKTPSLVRACKVTNQKLIYLVICIAGMIRGAYFIFPESLEYDWSSSLLSSYYPLLMSSASLVVCYWAEKTVFGTFVTVFGTVVGINVFVWAFWFECQIKAKSEKKVNKLVGRYG